MAIRKKKAQQKTCSSQSKTCSSQRQACEHCITTAQGSNKRTKFCQPQSSTWKVVFDWALQGHTLSPLLFNFPANSSGDCINPYCDIQQTMEMLTRKTPDTDTTYKTWHPALLTDWTREGDIATSNQQRNSSQFKKLGFQLGMPQNKPQLAVTAQSAFDQTAFQDHRR